MLQAAEVLQAAKVLQAAECFRRPRYFRRRQSQVAWVPSNALRRKGSSGGCSCALAPTAGQTEALPRAFWQELRDVPR